jgi:hypothetical protein
MNLIQNFHHLFALAVAALVAASPSFAQTQPGNPARSSDEKVAAQTRAPGKPADYGVKLGAFFNDQQKMAARRYFTQRYGGRAKDCPPGMERANKVCAPPVQGRYWAVGQMLQPSVTVYPVPAPAMSQLPPAPDGYEYVLAGGDILMVSKALHLVVDMIEDVLG